VALAIATLVVAALTLAVGIFLIRQGTNDATTQTAIKGAAEATKKAAEASRDASQRALEIAERAHLHSVLRELDSIFENHRLNVMRNPNTDCITFDDMRRLAARVQFLCESIPLDLPACRKCDPNIPSAWTRLNVCAQELADAQLEIARAFGFEG